MKTRGITLITLMITIIVALIVVATGIVTVSNAVSNATLTAFAEDLSIIEEQTKQYYLLNGEYPTSEEEKEAKSQAYVADLTSDKETFKEELTLNGDYESNEELGAYYIVDLSKLEIEKTIRGTKQTSSDIYVVSAKTMRVYYLKGVSVRGEKYYSLSEKIIKYKKQVESNVTTNLDETTLSTIGSMSAKIRKKSWTNKMGITLDAYLNGGENLYVQVAGISGEKEINKNAVVGNNTYIIESLSDIVEVTQAEINTFANLKGKEKYIEIIKKAGTSELDRLRIELSNYDIIAPEELLNFNFEEGLMENVVSFKVEDGESGIEEIRYDYINKYNNETGLVEEYYEGVEELDPVFIKERGKKAKASQDRNSRNNSTKRNRRNPDTSIR